MTVILRYLSNIRYGRRIRRLHGRLGVPKGYGTRTGLPLQPEARRLVPIGPDIYQREQRLDPAAAAAWKRMRE
ncbi:MAG: hypothetical protein KJN94_08275, partial [Gammaproteobacteria bacterium]|nr:hypothetical protein [Gammaproteobacteria bacterium]